MNNIKFKECVPLSLFKKLGGQLHPQDKLVIINSSDGFFVRRKGIVEMTLIYEFASRKDDSITLKAKPYPITVNSETLKYKPLSRKILGQNKNDESVIALKSLLYIASAWYTSGLDYMEEENGKSNFLNIDKDKSVNNPPIDHIGYGLDLDCFTLDSKEKQIECLKSKLESHHQGKSGESERPFIENTVNGERLKAFLDSGFEAEMANVIRDTNASFQRANQAMFNFAGLVSSSIENEESLSNSAILAAKYDILDHCGEMTEHKAHEIALSLYRAGRLK